MRDSYYVKGPLVDYTLDENVYKVVKNDLLFTSLDLLRSKSILDKIVELNIDIKNVDKDYYFNIKNKVISNHHENYAKGYDFLLKLEKDQHDSYDEDTILFLYDFYEKQINALKYAMETEYPYEFYYKLKPNNNLHFKGLNLSENFWKQKFSFAKKNTSTNLCFKGLNLSEKFWKQEFNLKNFYKSQSIESQSF